MDEEVARQSHPDQEAGRIADELRSAAAPNGSACRIAKMTSLLHTFRDSSGTPVEIGAVLTALNGEVDVSVVGAPDAWPPRRSSLVSLSLNDNALSAADGHCQPIEVTRWKPGDLPEQVSVLSAIKGEGPGEVTWADVAPGSEASEVINLFSGMGIVIPELVVDDLLRRPDEAAIRDHGDGSGGMRALTVLAAMSFVDLSGDHVWTVLRPALNIVVGDGWLLTCWHPDAEGRSLLRRPFVSRATRAWLGESPYDAGSRAHTAGDLALELMSAVVDTYDSTQRHLEEWSAQTEAELLALLEAPGERPTGPGQRPASESEIELLGKVGWLLATSGELKRSLSTLKRGRFQNYDWAWFSDVTEHDRRNEGGRIASTDGRLSAAVEQLDVAHRDMRGLLELGRIHFDAERQRHNEQVDDILRKVTAAVLVPTLVAAVYGANTPLPLASSWASTVIMLSLMLICGSATYAYLHWAVRRR